MDEQPKVETKKAAAKEDTFYCGFCQESFPVSQAASHTTKCGNCGGEVHHIGKKSECTCCGRKTG